MASLSSPPSLVPSTNVSRSSSRNSTKSLHATTTTTQDATQQSQPQFQQQQSQQSQQSQHELRSRGIAEDEDDDPEGMVDLLASAPRPGSGIPSRNSSVASASGESFNTARKRDMDAVVVAIAEESSAVLPLSPRVLLQISKYAVDWALLHGLIVNLASERSRPILQHAPVALLPTPFPGMAYSEAVTAQQYLNSILLAVRNDHDFLLTHLSLVAEKDDFISKLLRILRAVDNEGAAQTVSLSLHRTDFVLHLSTAATCPVLRLVSLHTMAAAFAVFGSVVSDMHRHLLSRFALPGTLPRQAPVNHTLKNLVDVFARAVSLYCSMFGLSPNGAAILIVENSSDDPGALELRLVEQQLWDTFRIIVLRRSLTDVHAECQETQDRSVFIADHEIGVVFFRVGTRATDYTGAGDWSARLLLERSRAIKSPSVADQLSGHRHLLHVLARPGVLEQFSTSPAAISSLRGVLAGLHPLNLDDTEASLAIISDAPDEYLLQPTLGSPAAALLSGPDLVDRLLNMSRDDRALHALMERARPPMRRNYTLQGGSPSLGNVVSELGMFGAVLAQGQRVVHTSVMGHVLRSKMTDEDGGMSAGLAVLDSPYLV